MKPIRTLWILFFLLGTSAFAAQVAPHLHCLHDKSRLVARSKEIQTLVKADQEDRENWPSKSPEEMTAVSHRDEARQKRIGEIFGEGCFSKAEDYAAAALIFQHGSTPDHFFQTYIWSKRAVDLGDESQKRMMALGIDRYLVNTGRKQLFGSQANKPDLQPETCWCIQPVEKTFPDRLRKKLAGKTYAQALEWLKELNAGRDCPLKECTAKLKATPQGSVPGLW